MNLLSILFAATKQGMSGRYSQSSLYQPGKFLYVIFRVMSKTYSKRNIYKHQVTVP